MPVPRKGFPTVGHPLPLAWEDMKTRLAQDEEKGDPSQLLKWAAKPHGDSSLGLGFKDTLPDKVE